jgi:hypothetical protein
MMDVEGDFRNDETNRNLSALQTSVFFTANVYFEPKVLGIAREIRCGSIRPLPALCCRARL